MKTSRLSWGLLDPDGSPWHESFAYRSRAIEFAVQRCMGATTYDELGDNTRRWQYAYKRGYRVVRVRVTPAFKAT